jgi:hypothetical protein
MRKLSGKDYTLDDEFASTYIVSTLYNRQELQFRNELKSEHYYYYYYYPENSVRSETEPVFHHNNFDKSCTSDCYKNR